MQGNKAFQTNRVKRARVSATTRTTNEVFEPTAGTLPLGYHVFSAPPPEGGIGKRTPLLLFFPSFLCFGNEEKIGLHSMSAPAINIRHGLLMQTWLREHGRPPQLPQLAPKIRLGGLPLSFTMQDGNLGEREL